MSAPDPVVSTHQLSKMYSLYANPRDRLNQSLWYALPAFMRRKERRFFEEFWALRDISFSIRPGEVLGIIGQNGSGKSTLLQILAGTLEQTSGTLKVRGSRAALLELGSGFAPEFTGRENVYMAGSILGLDRPEIERRFDEIAAFADIGDFIDQPVKLYSSGMYVRLAFAVQTAIRPDLLVVDEVLSVGDIFFQQKCFARLEELIAGGTAVAVVSHDMGVIQRFSHRTVLLHRGESLFAGEPGEAVQRYYLTERAGRVFDRNTIPPDDAASDDFTGRVPDWPSPEAFLPLERASFLGGGGARCTGIALCRADGQPGFVFEMGETAFFFSEFELLTDIGVPIGGVTLTDHLNVIVHGKNSAQAGFAGPSNLPAGSRVRVRQQIDLALAPGQYTFSVGFSTVSAGDYADFADRPYAHFHRLEDVLVLVERAGVLQVIPRKSGIDIPFHGQADLSGDFLMEVKPE